jgi:hypothetical protein
MTRNGAEKDLMTCLSVSAFFMAAHYFPLTMTTDHDHWL